MTKKKMMAHYNFGGITFKIPVKVTEAGEVITNHCVDDHANLEELENGLTETEKAIAWSEFEYEQYLWQTEQNFPYSYNN